MDDHISRNKEYVLLELDMEVSRKRGDPADLPEDLPADLPVDLLEELERIDRA